MKMTIDYSLYLVTDRPLSLGRDLLEIIQKAIDGGVTIVQLREKNCATREFVELARAAKAVLDPKKIPLIINDRADVALAAGAAGLHIGQTDMAYKDARKIMGPDAIVGLSVENIQQVEDAGAIDPDYLGVGPIFATQTKPDAAPPIGLDGLTRIRKITNRPLVAIGAIHAGNARDVILAGADGVAVVSAICSLQDPAKAAKNLARAIRLAQQG
ncbi:MAG: thiamine phosphate synthase [Desulfatibacillum sp.]|nr:thiamine phosphate synthase [Desulfatibacillum sp.]